MAAFWPSARCRASSRDPRNSSKWRPAGDDDPLVLLEAHHRERTREDALQADGDGAMADFTRQGEVDSAVVASNSRIVSLRCRSATARLTAGCVMRSSITAAL